MTQGLARRLMPKVPVPGPDTILVAGEGWLDLARTRALWNDVFQAPASMIRKNDWIDKPSAGIPYLYVTTGIILGSALEQTGKPDEAQKVVAQAERVAKAAKVDEIFRQMRTPAALPRETGDVPAAQPIPLRAPRP